jgi:hypothetical protein
MNEVQTCGRPRRENIVKKMICNDEVDFSWIIKASI